MNLFEWSILGALLSDMAFGVIVFSAQPRRRVNQPRSCS
jgi:hypothetical protein